METQVLVKFDVNRTRNRDKVALAAKLLEELKDGPLLVRTTHTQTLAKYKRAQKEAGVEVPAYRTQKAEGVEKRIVVALDEGPFERTVPQPEWIK